VRLRPEHFKTDCAKFPPFSSRNPPFRDELSIFFLDSQIVSLAESHIYLHVCLSLIFHLLVTNFSHEERHFHFLVTVFGLFSSPIATPSDFLCILVYFHQ